MARSGQLSAPSCASSSSSGGTGSVTTIECPSISSSSKTSGALMWQTPWPWQAFRSTETRMAFPPGGRSGALDDGPG